MIYMGVIPVLSVREAAIKLDIGERHVRRLLATKEIKGRKLGHDWIVLDLNYTRKRKPKATVLKVKSRDQEVEG